MSVAELQLEIHQAIDSITDSNKLEALRALVIGSKKPFEAMSSEEYVDAVNVAKRQIENGEALNVEDLEKTSERW
jgi:hypothetical protein